MLELETVEYDGWGCMERHKAIESPEFLVLGALYLLAIAVGFGAETPAFAPPGLLMASVVLVILGHLLNVYKLADVVTTYPRICFALDLFLVGLLALVFNILAHPLTGGIGTMVPPSITSKEYSDFIAGDCGGRTAAEIAATAQDLVLKSLYKFFVLAGFVLITLIFWHLFLAVRRQRLERGKEVKLRHFWTLYVPDG